jgi:hypothetical protein
MLRQGQYLCQIIHICVHPILERRYHYYIYFCAVCLHCRYISAAAAIICSQQVIHSAQCSSHVHTVHVDSSTDYLSTWCCNCVYYRAAKERAASGATADTAATPAYATDEVEQGPATVAYEALQEVKPCTCSIVYLCIKSCLRTKVKPCKSSKQHYGSVLCA